MFMLAKKDSSHSTEISTFVFFPKSYIIRLPIIRRILDHIPIVVKYSFWIDVGLNCSVILPEFSDGTNNGISTIRFFHFAFYMQRFDSLCLCCGGDGQQAGHQHKAQSQPRIYTL